jgi:hypothetical protein
MKSLSLALSGALFLALSGPARAMPVDSVLSLVVLDGPDASDGSNVGALSFQFDADAAGGCRYNVSWDGSFDGYLAAGCTVEESKTRGHMTCGANTQATFDTMIAKVPRASCTGLDGFGQRQDLFMLVGLEMSATEGVIGLIQWTASAPFLYAFEAQPYP